MSKQAARDQQVNEWLDHLRRWKAGGVSLASYAKQQGIAEWKLYQWRSRLIRDGRWPATPREASPVRFARVAVASSSPVYLVRLRLSNGRCAEIEMAQMDPLIHLIGALEKQP